MPGYLELVWLGALVLAVSAVAAAIVEAVGRGRLGRWLRVDVTDDDR